MSMIVVGVGVINRAAGFETGEIEQYARCLYRPQDPLDESIRVTSQQDLDFKMRSCAYRLQPSHSEMSAQAQANQPIVLSFERTQPRPIPVTNRCFAFRRFRGNYERSSRSRPAFSSGTSRHCG